MTDMVFPFKVGNGYDVHQIAQGLPMWLGDIALLLHQ